jgi:hypothetical protein
MKKVLFLSAIALTSGFIFLMLINQAQAGLIYSGQTANGTSVNYYGSTDGVTGEVDNPTRMSEILGHDVWLLDKDPGGDGISSLEDNFSYRDVTWNDFANEGDTRYDTAVEFQAYFNDEELNKWAFVSWDFRDTGYSAEAIAIKDGNTPVGSGPKWVWYAITEDQRLVGAGIINTLANGGGAISHVSVYSTPLPTSIILLGAGLLGIVAIRRKLRKS